MTVVVTGSRNWTDAGAIRVELMRLPINTTVIHGGARGADLLAMSIAQDIGLPVITFPANWKEFGKRAGPIRNQDMIEQHPDLVLAFPLKDSIGTWDCVRKAEKAGIQTRVCAKYL